MGVVGGLATGITTGGVVVGVIIGGFVIGRNVGVFLGGAVEGLLVGRMFGGMIGLVEGGTVTGFGAAGQSLYGGTPKLVCCCSVDGHETMVQLVTNRHTYISARYVKQAQRDSRNVNKQIDCNVN
jgi:hypothetical protein